MRGVFERVVRNDDPITRSTAIGRLRTLAHDDPTMATATALEVRIDSSIVAEEIAALLVSELHDRGHPLRDPVAVNRLLNSLTPLADLGGYWMGELLRRLAQEHLLVVTRFFLDRINLARDQAEDMDRVEAIPFEWKATPKGHRVAELPGATEALQLVRDAMLEPDWAHEWWIPRLFAALA